MITKNYIKMCVKAKKIQEKWRKPFKSYIGDLYWQGEEYLMIPEACICVTEIMFEPKDEHIWLPTQEQLQEIVLPILKKQYNKYWDLVKINRQGNWVIDIFYLFTKKNIQDINNNPIHNHSNNITELWLAFVMYEKYNKIWLKGRWVKNE